MRALTIGAGIAVAILSLAKFAQELYILTLG